MNNFLKYGDLVIFFHSDQEVSPGKSAIGSYRHIAVPGTVTGGVLTSPSFTESGLYFQMLPKGTVDILSLEEDEIVEMNQWTATDMLGIKEGIFKVTPRLNFDSHKEFQKNMENFRNVEANLKVTSDEDDIEKLSTIRDDLLARIERLQERMKKEQLINVNIIRDSLGAVVTYGTEVQLMHVGSMSFLSASGDSAEADKLGYGCCLSNWFSPNMVFKPLPRYKSRREGDPIQMRDYLIWHNMKRDAYLSVADANDIPLYDDRAYGPVENPFMPDVQVVDPKTERRTAYLSQDPSWTFQVILYRRYSSLQSENYLYGGDIVKIAHSETDAELCSDISYDGEIGAQVYLRTYNGEIKEEVTSSAGYWFIELGKWENGGERFPFPKSSNNNYEDMSQRTPPIRLRNVVTGKLMVPLADSDNPVDGGFHVRTSYLSSTIPVDLQFEFQPVVVGNEYLQNMQTVFIKEKRSETYLRCMKSSKIVRWNEILQKVLEGNDQKYLFDPLNDADLNESRVPVFFSRNFSQEDAFRIQKISDEDRREIMLVRSALPVIKHLSLLFRMGLAGSMNGGAMEYEPNSSARSPEKKEFEYLGSFSPRGGKKGQRMTFPGSGIQPRALYSKVTKCLQSIIEFLFDLDSTAVLDYYGLGADPIPRRQKLLRETGLLGALVELVYRPFRSGLFFISDLANDRISSGSNPNLQELLRICYSTIRYGVKEYRPNELFLSQWLELITKQSIEAQGSNDIFAGQALLELIDNNRRILETRISSSTLSCFIGYLQENRDSRFVELLRVICICDREPMQRNQRIITDMILDKPEVAKSLLYSLIPDNLDGVLFSLEPAGFEGIPFKELELVSSEKDSGETLNYVVVLTNLLADLCRHRNYSAIEKLASEFPYAVCYTIISDQEYPPVLRDAFVCLTLALWIDISPLQPIELPLKIKVWEESKHSEIFKPATEVAAYGALRTFAISYLQTMRRESVVDMRLNKKKLASANAKKDGVVAGAESRWSLDLSVLTLVHHMLNLGLFTDVEQIEAIVVSLKKYLRPDKNKKANMGTESAVSKGVTTIAKSFTAVNVGKSFSKQLSESLAGKITGENDKESEEELDASLVLLNCKKRVCEILKFCLQVSNELRVHEYLQSFKEVIDSIDPKSFLALEHLLANDEFQEHLETIEEREEAPPKVLEQAIVAEEKAYFVQITKKMGELFERITSTSNSVKLDKDSELLLSLVDLMSYRDNELKRLALELISQLYTQRQQLGTIIFGLQIIDDRNSLDHFQQAKDYKFTINTIGDSVEKWYKNPDSQEMTKLGMILNNIYRSLLSIQRKGSIIEIQRDVDSQSNADKLKHDLNSLSPGHKGDETNTKKRSSFLNQLPGLSKGASNMKSLNSPDASGLLSVGPSKKGGPQVPVLGNRPRLPSDSNGGGSGGRSLGNSFKQQEVYAGRRNNISPTFLDLKAMQNLTDIHQYHIDSESENIDVFEQDLFRNSGIYEGLLKLLAFDIQEGPANRPREVGNIIRKIYRILSKSSKDSISNKHYLSRALDNILLKHFEEPVDLNAYFLLYELVSDNKIVLLDEDKLTRIVKILCRVNESLQNEDIKKAFHLCILKSLIRYKNLVLQKNQNIILSYVVAQNNLNLQELLSVRLDSEISVIPESRNDYFTRAVTKINGKDVIILPAKLCYVISMLDLLSSCAENKNTLAETVCQTLLNLDTIKELLSDEGISIVLKRPLVSFLYQVYLAHDRDIPAHVIEVFLDTTIALYQEFNMYLTKNYSYEMVDTGYLLILSDASFKPWQLLVEDYLSTLTECFFNICKRELKLVKDSEPQKRYSRFMNDLLTLLSAKSISASRVLLTRFTDLTRVIILKRRSSGFGYATSTKFLQDDDFDLEVKEEINESAEGAEQQAKARRSQRAFTKHKTNIVGRVGLFKKIEALVEFYFTSVEYHKVCSKEIFNLIMALGAIDSVVIYGAPLPTLTAAGFIGTDMPKHAIIPDMNGSPRQGGLFRSAAFMESVSSSSTGSNSVSSKAITNLNKVFSSISKYIESAVMQYHNDGSTHTVLVAVEIFRRYIEARPISNPAQAPKLFEEDFWNQEKAKIRLRQDRLCNLGIVKLVCTILQQSEDRLLCREALVLSIALLWGGNSKVQKSFLEHLNEDLECLLLDKVKNLLTKSFGVLFKIMNERNAETLKMYIAKLEETDADQEAYEKERAHTKLLRKVRYEVEAFELNYSICKCVFKFLQLLCEGHNEPLQLILKGDQSRQAPNFIALSASIWGSFIKIVNPECEELGGYILEFLTESIQGPCTPNQLELYHNRFIEFTKDFMSDFVTVRDFTMRGFDGRKSCLKLDALILKCIKTLQSMLEANPLEELSVKMATQIDFNYLIRKLTYEFKKLFNIDVDAPDDEDIELAQVDLAEYNQKLKGKMFGFDFQQAFGIFFFMKTVDDQTGMYRRKIAALNNTDATAYSFFAHHSAYIEVVYKDSILKQYFEIHPACRYLQEDEKQMFLDTAVRDTPINKINHFLQQAPKLFDRMDQMAELQSKLPIFTEGLMNNTRNITFGSSQFIISDQGIDGIIFGISLALNLFMFAVLKKQVRGTQSQVEFETYEDIIIKILGIMHIVSSFVHLIVWSVLNMNLVLIDGWRERLNQIRRSILLTGSQAELDMSDEARVEYEEIVTLLERHTSTLTRSDILRIMEYYARKQVRTYTISALIYEYFAREAMFLLSSKTLCLLVFYLALSLIAYITKLRILYVVHLYDIINMFDTLGNIIIAITANGKQLLLTAFFMIIVLFIYTLFAFEFVDDTFWFSRVDPAGESVCQTLFQCFFTLLALGPRQSGSIGDILLQPTYGVEPVSSQRARYMVRWAYDVSIFFIVNIICLKLVFGIILDTFSQLRDLKKTVDHDKRNVCYICNLDRYTVGLQFDIKFDKFGDGFENHIRRDHKLWNYLYFLYFLKHKESTEYNGIESYISEQLFQDEIRWIPLGRAAALAVQSESDSLATRVNDLMEEAQKLQDIIQKHKDSTVAANAGPKTLHSPTANLFKLAEAMNKDGV